MRAKVSPRYRYRIPIFFGLGLQHLFSLWSVARLCTKGNVTALRIHAGPSHPDLAMILGLKGRRSRSQLYEVGGLGLRCITLRAKLSGAVYCYRPWLCVCVFATGGRAGGRCPNLATASARAVFASLWALVSLLSSFVTVSKVPAFAACHFGGHNYAAVWNGRSTAYQRSSRSQWRSRLATVSAAAHAQVVT